MRPWAWINGPRLALFLVLVAFLFRLLAFSLDNLDNLALGPDGGWSLAMASLGPERIFDLLSQEIHPPLYYLGLHYWTSLTGGSGFAAKYFSLLPSVIAVALMYRLGRRMGGKWVGVWAALVLASMPLHLFHAGVVRDASLSVLLLLGSSHAFLGLISQTDREEKPLSKRLARWAYYLLVTLAGLYTSYLFIFLVIAQGVYALFVKRGRAVIGYAAMTSVALLLGYAPWLARVVPEWTNAAQQGSALAGAEPRLLDPLQYVLLVAETLSIDAVFPLTPWLAVVAFGVVIAGGFYVGRNRQRAELSYFVLALVIGTGFIFGVASLARGQGEGIASRYIIIIAPFFALILAAAIDGMVRNSAVRASLLIVPIIGLLYLGADAFLQRPELPESLWSPRGMVNYLDSEVRTNEAIVFTSLGQAGYYVGWSGQQLPWYYISGGEDIYLAGDISDQIASILPEASGKYEAVWLVLYQGLNERKASIKRWLDINTNATDYSWQGDSMVYVYANSGTKLDQVDLRVRFGDGITLDAVETLSRVEAGDYIPVILHWRALKTPRNSYSVFVHLLDEDGQLIAQNDSPPANGSSPTSSWLAGESIEDRRALRLPGDVEAGSYRIEIGLYSEQGRLELEDGSSSLSLTEINISR